MMEIPPVSKVTPVCGGEGREERGGRREEREETGKKMGGSREGRETERMDRGEEGGRRGGKGR